MIDIERWLDDFSEKLIGVFKERILFIGLQGSYARGEATEKSDIDVVVILDRLSPSDIRVYNEILNTLSHRNLVCGFLSGKNELLNWDPSDLFQFYHDTKPLKGNLNLLLPLIDDSAVQRAIKTGVCNIYHAVIHNMLFTKSEEILKSLYKSASFVMQAVYFRKTGKYVTHQKELSKLLSGDEKEIIDTFIDLKQGKQIEFQIMSEALFNWCKNMIVEVYYENSDFGKV